MKPELVVATYNIHRCLGTDRCNDPKRIASVLGELQADVVGLQEVDSGVFVKGGSCQAKMLGSIPGFEAIHGPTIRTAHGTYGNVLMSKWPIVDYKFIDLGVRFREPRGAICATISVRSQLLNVITTHFGLGFYERRLQYRKLAAALIDLEHPKIIMGDFNEWSPFRRSGSAASMGHSGRRLLRTFPSWRPMLPLDRIYVQPGASLTKVEVHRSPLSRIASDHLPVKAFVSL